MGRAVLLRALGAEPVKGGRGRDGRARTGLNAQCPTAIAAGHCGVRGLCFFLFPFFFSLCGWLIVLRRCGCRVHVGYRNVRRGGCGSRVGRCR